ncbi:thiamine-phosphate kinase [Sphingomonas sp. DG1-23]|uniref:thiamine-phosphate kinase n=1 Tax=Sphingomonas sp. DG1-23 TaxID=3068316 RepID=UPI00273EFD50|nr:thiamine-phosphate kinase [Sphingomonas sp. DG1-23]MDP5280064.1 thiamine-phosphate kinase [Sphingomonas sp. DG1-23]
MSKFDREHADLTIADVGEKALIVRYVRPIFNPAGDPWGVGDDCALARLSAGHAILASTDRVPADLISFKAGVLDHAGLGSYLVRLNLSDIAACGGRPIGLLLNFGLPRRLPLADFEALVEGVRAEAALLGCPVLGGDLSDATELSISATALGSVDPRRALSRSTAKVGDTIFVSRPIGLTPAAFRYLRDPERLQLALCPEALTSLHDQFRLSPLLDLGQALAASGSCSACMDNTDGLSQTLNELAAASGVRIVLDAAAIDLPDLVCRIARACGEEPLDLALSAGADFSLVGALSGSWSEEAIRGVFGPTVRRIGHATTGDGVYLQTSNQMFPVQATGWNYYD